MICHICGSTESYTEGGIEYCKECSVQFKSSQDEKSADESFSKRTLQSTPDISKAKKKKEKKYSPWFSAEAYNLILSKQVSALIKLGCSNKLKDVVLYIWAKYLQKCETAFMKEHYYDKNKPRLSIAASDRDKKVLYGIERLRKKPKTSLKGKSTSSNRKKKSDKVTEIVSKIDISDSETESHLSYDSGSDTAQEKTNNSSSKTSQKRIKKKPSMFSSHAKKIMRAGKKKVDIVGAEACVHHMTLNKTLSFCHLGLLYTEDQLLLTDLIQLVNDGTVPFIDVTRHFPISMQLQKVDNCHFNRYAAPEIQTITLNSAKLVHFLKLPKFKTLSILSIAARFVKDFNLPNDIIPVLKVLKDKLPERNEKWFDNINTKRLMLYHIPIYEIQAASLVVVALKMLFVLDGKYEVEHSETMVKLNSITEENKFFVWKEWQKQTSMKEYLFIKRDLWYNDISRLDSLIADRIIERYPFYGIKPELCQLQYPVVLKDVKARYQTKVLLDDLIESEKPKKKPTSFPLQYELGRLMSEWRELHLFKDTSNIDFDLISKDFSQHKLFYNPSAFQSDQLIHLLLSSLYESVELLHINIAKDELHFRENVIRTSTKYWYLDCFFRSRHPEFNENFFEDLPPSFKWLFKFFCKYLRVDREDLYAEINYMEKKLFVLQK